MKAGAGEPSGQPAAVTWAGVQMKKVAVPSTSPFVPLNVAVSVTSSPNLLKSTPRLSHPATEAKMSRAWKVWLTGLRK